MLIEKGLEQRFRAFFQFFDNFGDRAAAAVQFTVGTRKRLNTLFGEFFGMQAQGMQIESSIANRIARRFGTRGNITVHLVSAPYKSVSTHLIALLYSGNATNGRILANTHMPAQLAGVRNNDTRSDIAIMGNM